MENLDNVLIVTEKEKKVIVKFENENKTIDNITPQMLNTFFQNLSKKHVNGFQITFELGDEPKKEDGFTDEKAFAYIFAKSFKKEWNNSLPLLDQIKKEKDKIIEYISK